MGNRLGMLIEFHNMLHGFKVNRGTGKYSLEENLLKNMVSMSEEVLYEIFLNLYKVYDAMDWYLCLKILEGYVIGPSNLRLPR